MATNARVSHSGNVVRVPVRGKRACLYPRTHAPVPSLWRAVMDSRSTCSAVTLLSRSRAAIKAPHLPLSRGRQSRYISIRTRRSWWYVFKSKYTFEVGRQELCARAGHTVFARRGIRHTFQNISGGFLMASISALPAQYSYGSDQDLERMLGRPILGGRVHIVVIGAHPDDAETGCGGTIAKLTGDGHRVTIIYLTRGEAGVRGGHHATTARVRTAEALAGSRLLGARAVFANQ